MPKLCDVISEKDKEKIALAIRVLQLAPYDEPMTLALRVYSIAFSQNFKLKGTPAEILKLAKSPDGSPASDELSAMLLRIGKEDSPLAARELLIGDAVVYGDLEDAEVLVYDGECLVSFSEKPGQGRSLRDALDDVNSKEVFIHLRPMQSVDYVEVEKSFVKEDEISDAAKALCQTAEAYLLRGYRCQYDDTRFTKVGGGEYRWQIGKREAEDYTADRYGYVNCAAFTYEVYRTALGMDLGALYTTFNLMRHYSKNGFVENEPMYPFYYELTNNETEAEKAKIAKALMSTLRVGDLVVYRRHNESGHVMMYVGENILVHSTGGNYNYAEARETHEPTIRYMHLAESFFDEKCIRYVFSDSIAKIGIVRPLAIYDGQIPENTRNRVKNMRGITAEKLSSVKGSHKVAVGSIVEYTFRLYNFSSDKKCVDIRDRLPLGVEYVGGADSFVGGEVCYDVELLPCQYYECSYRVKVVADEGSVISGSGAKICGVAHPCSDIAVGKCLTDSEKGNIARVAEDIIGKGALSGLSLVNSVYKSAGLDEWLNISGLDELEKDIFESEEFLIFNEDSNYRRFIPRGLHGGRILQTQNRYSAECKDCSDRVRLPRPFDLEIGDVIVANGTEGKKIYFYTGGVALVNITENESKTDSCSLVKRLEGLLAEKYFVILRYHA